MIRFKRFSNSPFLEPKTGTVAPDAVTTPDILEHQNNLYLFVGAVASEKERILCQSFPLDAMKMGVATFISSDARVIISPGPQQFDNRHVFDPASLSLNDDILLFYSAIGEGDDSIGMAKSIDGLIFTKQTSSILYGRSPEVCLYTDRLYLFFVKKKPPEGYRIYSAILSMSGDIEQTNPEPILFNGEPGSWDQYEVTTPRIIKRRGEFYMLYAGSNNVTRQDKPIGFGLARSRNLIDWEKYSHNPVFELGSRGDWDDGAVWFGTPFEYQDFLYLIYEGGRLEDIPDNSPARTKVGLACISLTELDLVLSDWD